MTEACDFLAREGWHESRDFMRPEARCFYRFFAAAHLCRLNKNKPGIQVCVAVYGAAYELELAGELADGSWLRLCQWGLPDSIEEGVALVPRLVAMWEAANEA